MSELTYKKIVDVEQVETLNDAATVFINDDGTMKQVGADKFGAVKTVNGVEPDENGNIVVEVPEIPEPVQPDWNQNDPNAADYVKNRTHWVETGLVEEVPETEVAAEVEGDFAVAVMDANICPTTTEEGEVRIIVFDGKAYECAMFITEGHSFGNNAIVLGDEVPDTGEPFLYIYIPGDICTVMTKDTEPTTHTIAVYKQEEVVHTIDPKYLPAGGSGGVFVVTVTGNDSDGYTADKTFAEIEAACQARQVVGRYVENINDMKVTKEHTLNQIADGVGYAFTNCDYDPEGNEIQFSTLLFMADGSVNRSLNCIFLNRT